MITATHLTSTELDALLEAARAATPGPWDFHGYTTSYHITRLEGNFHCSPRVVHATLGGSIHERDDPVKGAGGVREYKDAKYIALANPATIERLVLMVRELQRDVEVSRRLVSRNLHDQIEGVFGNQQYITERFRARAIQELRKLYEVNTPYSADISLGYTTALEKALTVIKSLPLVETEEE